MGKIALCIIATNDYCYFVSPLIESAEKYFLQGHETHYHVFSNNMAPWPFNFGQNPIRMHMHVVHHEPWPAMTLNRYYIIGAVDLSGYDYVYYIDADMLFVSPVGDEILAPLTGVLHPGFFTGGGSWETNPVSTAYVPPHKRTVYLAGGFQGGSAYWNYCKVLAECIETDSVNGITAVWHDESHWNRLYTTHKPAFTLLNPGYCMVEEKEKRIMWGIDKFEPKIIALAKDHKTIRK